MRKLDFQAMSREELSQVKQELEKRYHEVQALGLNLNSCLLYTSPSPRD